MLEYALLAGAIFGLYFALVGLGLNLVFGVMRIVNLAHGDFLMLGAFSAFGLFSLLRLNPLFSVAIVLTVFTLLGLPLYSLLVPRLLRAKDPEMLSLIFFFGLSQAIEAVATIAFGPSERSIPGQIIGHGPAHLLGQGFPAAWIVSAIVSAAAVLGVYLYLYRSRLGHLTRAVMEDREEALASGIDVHKVSAAAFGLGIGLAGIAGVFSPFMLGSATPDMGVDLTIQSFTVIVIGSLGNPLGTVLGGIIYGVSLMFMETYFSSWANLLPYVLLMLILLVRPSGLLGRRVRRA